MEVKKNSQQDADDDDDEDDDEDGDPNPEEMKGKYIDYIGNLKGKLKKNNLKYVIHEQDPNNIAFTGRSFDTLLTNLSNIVHAEEKQDNYPNRKRFIAMIDRRTESQKNTENVDHDVVLYEPPSMFI